MLSVVTISKRIGYTEA